MLLVTFMLRSNIRFYLVEKRINYTPVQLFALNRRNVKQYALKFYKYCEEIM